MRRFLDPLATLASLATLACALATAAAAQVAPSQVAPSQVTPAQSENTRTPTEAAELGLTTLTLSANFAGDAQAIPSGLQWRVFDEKAAADGSHALVVQSSDARPSLRLPLGSYVVHVGYGLASAIKRVTVTNAPAGERLTLNAGALRVVDVLGDMPIPAGRVALSIFVPERGNSAAKLIVSNTRPGTLIRLPEGTYRVISTYLEKDSGAAPANASGVPANATNSVVNADLRVQTGKLTEATLRHRAATLTLKLVNAPGGEALANTNFSVLTPGGDVIREMIGAFPSLVLAEGEYVVLARHDGKTFQSTFVVQTGLDRDVEVVAK